MDSHLIRRTNLPQQGRKLFIFWLALFLSVKAGLTQTASLNVADFGAKGDAVQFYVNTVSNSTWVTTTNRLSSADIGKTIEIFGAGAQTYGKNSYGVNAYANQDLIAKITNVSDATNIYISVAAQATCANAFATYGTDNTPMFSNAVVSAYKYTSSLINIPDGKYLLMPVYRIPKNYDGYGFASIVIHRGGLHFLGESKENTILLSRGAWQTNANSSNLRGFLLECTAPITNRNQPIILENLTLDGGVQQGFINAGNASGYANKIDGLGWDVTHGAYLTTDSGSGTGTADNTYFTNVIVQHWRGEMLKSIDGNTNGHIHIHDCLFADGSATALNIYGTWDVAGNTFSNLFQIAEYYQRYTEYLATPSYFCNNYTTNIWYNAFAFNGGDWFSPPFIMQSNIFYLNGSGFNGVMTMPAANIYISNNEFHCADYMTVFNIGAAGSQPYKGMVNSNIVISGNLISAPAAITSVFNYGGGGVSKVFDITICSNTVVTAKQIFSILSVGPQAVGARFYDNVINCPMTSMQTGTAGTGNSPFVLIQTNNAYTAFPTYIDSVKTNLISYISGPKQRFDYVATGNIFVLDDSTADQIPTGAYIDIDNRSNRWGALHGGVGGDILVYPSKAMKTGLVTVTNGQVTTFYWARGAWTTQRPIAPPSNLRPEN